MSVYLISDVLHRAGAGHTEVRPITKILIGPSDMENAYEAFLEAFDESDEKSEGWDLVNTTRVLELTEEEVAAWEGWLRTDAEVEGEGGNEGTLEKRDRSHLRIVK